MEVQDFFEGIQIQPPKYEKETLSLLRRIAVTLEKIEGRLAGIEGKITASGREKPAEESKKKAEMLSPSTEQLPQGDGGDMISFEV